MVVAARDRVRVGVVDMHVVSMFGEPTAHIPEALATSRRRDLVELPKAPLVSWQHNYMKTLPVAATALKDLSYPMKLTI